MCKYIILEDFDMDKYIYDETGGPWYDLKGDYYFPCLVLQAEKGTIFMFKRRLKIS